MNVSARVEYACLAVMDLAENYGSGRPVQIRRIAQTHGIPSKFLVQILLQLKGAGLVASTRGVLGGYELVRDPADITLADVMAVIDGPRGTFSSSASTITPSAQALSEAWVEAAEAQQERLGALTIAELLGRARGRAAHMYYI